MALSIVTPSFFEKPELILDSQGSAAVVSKYKGVFEVYSSHSVLASKRILSRLAFGSGSNIPGKPFGSMSAVISSSVIVQRGPKAFPPLATGSETVTQVPEPCGYSYSKLPGIQSKPVGRLKLNSKSVRVASFVFLTITTNSLVEHNGTGSVDCSHSACTSASPATYS